MDWKKLISELMECGMTQTAIGEHVGLTQGAVSQILTGTQSDVKWTIGQKLRALRVTKLAERDATAREPSVT